MSERSARFALPFLVPGQAQKELYHNEALVILDAITHAAVEDRVSEPPAVPAEGLAWIVGEGATGAWAERQRQIAAWTSEGWRFVEPVEGMRVFDRAAGHDRTWSGTDWSDGSLAGTKLVINGQQVVGTRQPAPPSPSGGTIIDAEARAAIEALTVSLRSHGLID